MDVHQPPAFLHKLLQLAGVRLRFEELPPQEEPPKPPLQIGSCSGYMELTVKLKQNEAFPGPKVGLRVPGPLGSGECVPSQNLQQCLSSWDKAGLSTRGNDCLLGKWRNRGLERSSCSQGHTAGW